MFDAIVLAGGSARRLGGADKPALEVGGSTLLERVIAAVPSAARVVAVGPARPVPDDRIVWCREDPPGGGPVAAVASALPLTTAPVVLVLAADLPAVAPAVPVLLAALGAEPTADIGARVATGITDVALLVDANGRRNDLASAWRRRALVRALATIGEPRGAAMRTLAATAHVVEVADPDGWGTDCDTWADVALARRRYR